jgi:hypothetical protein
MSEQEYTKYLDDMQELEKLRRVKRDFAKNARDYFDDIDFWLKHERSQETIFGMISVCQKEDADKNGYRYGYYCDHCPFPDILGCPFGLMWSIQNEKTYILLRLF